MCDCCCVAVFFQKGLCRVCTSTRENCLKTWELFTPILPLCISFINLPTYTANSQFAVAANRRESGKITQAL